MIQLRITDSLQNFSNVYVFSTQEDMIAAVHMLLDFACYGEEHLKSGSLRLELTSDIPLDTGNPFYEFYERKEKQV